MNYADVVFGLSWGDEGKGKVANYLAGSNNYTHVARWNGGPNAGHTIFINEKKYKTHIIPCGVFHNIMSIIGPNCVINIDKFYNELNYLKDNGFNTDLVKVSPKANVITEDHIEYDKKFLYKKLGTTAQGIAPCYADKMLRKGIRAKEVLESKYIWDEDLDGATVLCEGAQSFWLDINYGDYPHVTSSETLPYGACSLGFSPKKILAMYGIAKIYDTKSGVDPLFPDSLWKDKYLLKLAEIGQEYGSTTGRKRLVNWLRLDKLKYAIKISGITTLIINKCDILEELGVFRMIIEGAEINFPSLEDMQDYIRSDLANFCEVIFSSNELTV